MSRIAAITCCLLSCLPPPQVSATITNSGYHGTHLAGTLAAVGNNHTGVIGMQYHA